MTDEQRMREAFEVVRVAEYGILSVDRDPETGEYVRRSTYEAWGHFVAGWLARDAEVQALREALTEVTEDLASEVIARYGPILTHPNTVRRFDRDMELVYRARKLLAGGETGETE